MVRCIGIDGSTKQVPSDETFEITLEAYGKYETQVPVQFQGLGYMTTSAQPVAYADYSAAAGDLSCGSFGGASYELAMILDFPLGSCLASCFVSFPGQGW